MGVVVTNARCFGTLWLAAVLLGCGRTEPPSPPTCAEVPIRLKPRHLAVHPITCDFEGDETELVGRLLSVYSQAAYGQVSVSAHAHAVLLRPVADHPPFGPLGVAEGFDTNLALLLDSDLFIRQTGGFPILTRTPEGIVCASRSRQPGARAAGAPAMDFINHVDVLPALGVWLGLPTDRLVHVSADDRGTLEQLVRGSLARQRPGREPFWSLIAYMAYLDHGRWTDRHGAARSVDDLVVEVLASSPDDSVCYGGHRGYALAAVFALHERYRLDFPSPHLVADVEAELLRLKAAAEASQSASGAWGKTRARPDDAPPALTPQSEDDLELTITSHLLDAFAVCPPRLRPDDRTLEKGLHYLYGRFRSGGLEIFDGSFSPMAHALRATVLLPDRLPLLRDGGSVAPSFPNEDDR